MSNTLGNSIKVTLIGESHGKAVGAVIDGLPAGIPVDESSIAAALSARRPSGTISTARHEEDKFEIVSGVFRGYTSGSPICVIIPNKDTKSEDYGDAMTTPRPGHADFTAHTKYAGYEDFRGGGHFSGRITAALVAAGAIVNSALEAKGVTIGTHIAKIADVADRSFNIISDDLAALKNNPFPVLDALAAESMKSAIKAAASDGDSVGGVLESAVSGLPCGVGDPWFDTVEGKLSYALFSIPAVKGVEFGAGFGASSMRGSENNDPIVIEDGKPSLLTNNCGGILGGITTGGTLIFRTAVKPTPTISKEQRTVDFSTGCETNVSFGGRHDPCIVHRAAAVQNAVAALVVADMLTDHFGKGFLVP